MKNKLIAAGSATLLALGLVVTSATAASAVEVSSYCLSNLNARTQNSTELPSKALICQMQAGPARAYGYTGPINGVMGANSWKGIQSYLKAKWGYTGAISGKTGKSMREAMERAANATGFQTTPQPIDGALSLKDWQGWAYRVRINFFTD
ncbi:MAG: hypothetical protein QOF79_556 [Actinomycetota bacterium]|nr:hypothetical protein [Actinomycetota bacterium]